MTRSWLDVGRILVISGAGLTIGLAFYIACVYLRAYGELPPARQMARWGPLQLVGSAIVHSAYTAFGAMIVMDRLGDGLSFDTPFLGALNALSAAVLLTAARKERRRVKAARRASILGAPLRRVDDR